MTDHVRVAFNLWLSQHPEGSRLAAWTEASRLAGQHDLDRTNRLYMPVLQATRLLPATCADCSHPVCKVRRALDEFWKELRA